MNMIARCLSSTFSINVVATLLLVSIVNVYYINNYVQEEHYAKQIHINHQHNLLKINPNGGNNHKQLHFRKGLSTSSIEGKVYKQDPCLPVPTTQQELLDLPLTVVTAANENYVAHLLNLLGSIHTHQPNTEVAIYDLGLKKSTVQVLEKYCKVTVRPFNFDAFPNHVRTLKNFAWKALVVKRAVEEYGKILYLDSGYEIRRPLDFIRGRIEREGYFCVGMGDSLTRGGREEMFSFFETSTLDYFGLPMCGSGVHGVSFWSSGYKNIILPAAECSLSLECITPVTSGKEGRFSKDQALFSALMYKGGCTQCAMSYLFTTTKSELAGDPFEPGKQHLFIRKGPGPFNSRGLASQTCFDSSRPAMQRWQLLRNRYNVTTEKTCPHTRFSQKHSRKDYIPGDLTNTIANVKNSIRKETLTIITAGTEDEFYSIATLVQSLLDWEPDRKVVVYDLGLHVSNTDELLKKKIIVEKVDFSVFPDHVRDLSNYAYKPIVLWHAANKYGSILYLSPTHMLYQSLDTVILQLRRDGIFTPTVGSNVLDLIQYSEAFFSNWFAVPAEKRGNGTDFAQEFAFKPECSASVIGFWRDSLAAKLVLPPLHDCSLDATCWMSAVQQNKDKPDGLLLSLLIYEKICYTCNRDYDFYAYSGKKRHLFHPEPDFDLLSHSLMEEVQVLYDTKIKSSS